MRKRKTRRQRPDPVLKARIPTMKMMTKMRMTKMRMTTMMTKRMAATSAVMRRRTTSQRRRSLRVKMATSSPWKEMEVAVEVVAEETAGVAEVVSGEEEEDVGGDLKMVAMTAASSVESRVISAESVLREVPTNATIAKKKGIYPGSVRNLARIVVEAAVVAVEDVAMVVEAEDLVAGDEVEIAVDEEVEDMMGR